MEGTPEKPVDLEPLEVNPLLEKARGFAADESEQFTAAINSRADEEPKRPGLMRRLAASANARMAMTIVAGATALTMGGATDAGASERARSARGSGRSGRAVIIEVLEGAQRGVSGYRRLDTYRRQRDVQMRREISRDARRQGAEARARAHEAQGAVRDAEYKLRGIERELPQLKRKIEFALYSAVKLAATDPGAREVRTIMLKRTALKIEIWKAGYEGKEDQVENLSRQDRELEDSLLEHLTGRIAQHAGELFVKTIMPGELKMLDLERQQEHLERAMESAGAAMGDAMARWEAHTRRAERAYELATIGIRVGNRR